MRLVQDLYKLNPNFIIITGDGRRELHILRGLTKVYNGNDLILYFPFSVLPKKTGKSALDSIKTLANDYGFNSIIYIVDGDAFDEPADIEIQDYLNRIGIRIDNVNLIQSALIINCRLGNNHIRLYCIISGPRTFIEEEIANLINLKWGIEVDLTGSRDRDWKIRVKNEVIRILREKNIKIESLIESTGKTKLELAFPNICAILKKIEEDNQM